MKAMRPSISAVVVLLIVVVWAVACAAPAPTPTPTPKPAAAAPTPAKATATPTPGIPKFAAGSVLDKIQKRGKLIAGVRYDVLYLGYLDPQTNKVVGFEVELAKELARAILGDPEKAEITQVTGKSRIPVLQAGEVDIVLANFTVTEERKKEVDFGKPHLILSYWAVVPKDSPIQKLSDFAGKKVSTGRGSEFLGDAIQAKVPNVEMVYLVTHPERVLALTTARVDVDVTDDFPSLDAIKSNPNLRRFKLEGILPPNEIAAGFRKGEPDFVEFWNQLLDKLAASGRVKELFSKTMPEGMDIGVLPFAVK